MSAVRSRSAFVPHDLNAPVIGSNNGPLAGLSAAVKDMYDVAGSRTGGGISGLGFPGGLSCGGSVGCPGWIGGSSSGSNATDELPGTDSRGLT